MKNPIVLKTVLAGLLACGIAGSVQAMEDFSGMEPEEPEYVRDGKPRVVNGRLNLSFQIDCEEGLDLTKINFADIEGIETVTKASLIYNDMESLPAGIEALENLEELMLEGNKLPSLPPELWQLKKLKRLLLGDTCDFLQVLPRDLPEQVKTYKLGRIAKELRERFEKLKRFIFKAIEENNALKVHMFLHERVAPWHLSLTDFKDENGNNLLHLTTIHHDKAKDPEWMILKELIAFNPDAAFKMLNEENNQGNTPIQLLLSNGVAHEKLNEILTYFCSLREKNVENKGKQEEL